VALWHLLLKSVDDGACTFRHKEASASLTYCCQCLLLSTLCELVPFATSVLDECLMCVTARDRRYSAGAPLRQRVSRSSRDLVHGEDMEAVVANALV